MLDQTKVMEEKKALEVLFAALEDAQGEDRDAVVEAIQAQAKRLQDACEDLEAEAQKLPQAQTDAQVEANVEILLTPAQRDAVKQETGVDVPSIVLQDPTGALTKHMSFIKPEFVQARAMEKALRFNEMIADIEQD